MTIRISVLAQALTLIMGVSQAHAWYGPFCYSQNVRTITLVQPTSKGENPGAAVIQQMDNNGDEVGGYIINPKKTEIRASSRYKSSHEIILHRDENSLTGVVGITIGTNVNDALPLKYEIDFEKSVEDCKGARIVVSGESSSDLGMGGSEAPQTAAKNSDKNRAKKSAERAGKVARAAAKKAEAREKSKAELAQKSAQKSDESSPSNDPGKTQGAVDDGASTGNGPHNAIPVAPKGSLKKTHEVSTDSIQSNQSNPSSESSATEVNKAAIAGLPEKTQPESASDSKKPEEVARPLDQKAGAGEASTDSPVSAASKPALETAPSAAIEVQPKAESKSSSSSSSSKASIDQAKDQALPASVPASAPSSAASSTPASNQ